MWRGVKINRLGKSAGVVIARERTDHASTRAVETEKMLFSIRHLHFVDAVTGHTTKNIYKNIIFINN